MRYTVWNIVLPETRRQNPHRQNPQRQYPRRQKPQITEFRQKTHISVYQFFKLSEQTF